MPRSLFRIISLLVIPAFILTPETACPAAGATTSQSSVRYASCFNESALILRPVSYFHSAAEATLAFFRDYTHFPGVWITPAFAGAMASPGNVFAPILMAGEEGSGGSGESDSARLPADAPLTPSSLPTPQRSPRRRGLIPRITAIGALVAGAIALLRPKPEPVAVQWSGRVTNVPEFRAAVKFYWGNSYMVSEAVGLEGHRAQVAAGAFLEAHPDYLTPSRIGELGFSWPEVYDILMSIVRAREDRGSPLLRVTAERFPETLLGAMAMEIEHLHEYRAWATYLEGDVDRYMAIARRPGTPADQSDMALERAANCIHFSYTLSKLPPSWSPSEQQLWRRVTENARRRASGTWLDPYLAVVERDAAQFMSDATPSAERGNRQILHTAWTQFEAVSKSNAYHLHEWLNLPYARWDRIERSFIDSSISLLQNLSSREMISGMDLEADLRRLYALAERLDGSRRPGTNISSVRVGVISAVGHLLGESGVTWLLSLAQNASESEEIRHTAVVALGGTHTTAIAPLLAMLDHTGLPGLDRDIIQALGSLGATTQIPDFRRRLRDPASPLSQRAGSLIALENLKAPEFASDLRELVISPTTPVYLHEMAVRALARKDPGGSLGVFLSVLRDRQVPETLQKNILSEFEDTLSLYNARDWGAFLETLGERFPVRDWPEEFVTNIGRRMNDLHDWAEEQNNPSYLAIREQLARTISDDLLYRLLAGGRELYTSTFGLLDADLQARLRRERTSLARWLQARDPARKRLPGFLLSLAQFRRLGPALRSSPELQTDFLALLGSAELSDLFLLSLGMDVLLKDPNLTWRAALEERILSATAAAGGRLRNAWQLFLIQERAHFRTVSSAAIERQTADFPAAARRRVEYRAPPYESLFGSTMRENRRLPVLEHHLFFYDIRHYDWIIDMYTRGYRGKMGGFRIVSRDAKHTVLEREVAGSLLQFVIHLGDDDRNMVLRQSLAGVVAHRGHSTELAKTFPIDTADPVQRTFLMLALSCGGFRDLAGLLDTYPDAFPIATMQVGRGAVNNLFMYYLAEALAVGREAGWSWDQIRAHVAANVPADQMQEFMFPNDLPVLLLRVPEPSPRAGGLLPTGIALGVSVARRLLEAGPLPRRRLLFPWTSRPPRPPLPHSRRQEQTAA